MQLTISAPVTLECSECGTGYFLETRPGRDYAQCGGCGTEVTISHDIERHMDAGERLVWVDDVTLRGPRVLAYFTEEEWEEEGVDY